MIEVEMEQKVKRSCKMSFFVNFHRSVSSLNTAVGGCHKLYKKQKIAFAATRTGERKLNKTRLQSDKHFPSKYLGCTKTANFLPLRNTLGLSHG